MATNTTGEILKQLNEIVNNLNNANNANMSNEGESGGISDWLFWIIINSVVTIVVTGTVFLVKYIIKKRRESNSIISDVANTVTTEVEKQVANNLLDTSIQSATQTAQLEANTKTAAQLYAVGDASKTDVEKAIVAAELSKANTEQENLKASKAIEDLRQKELAQADAAVFDATQKASKASADYENLSTHITAQNLQAAQNALAEITAKRQAADADYNSAIANRIAAETAAKKRLEDYASTNQSVIKSAQDRLKALASQIKDARTGVKRYEYQSNVDKNAKQQPKPKLPSPSPAPKPSPSPAPQPSPSPAPKPSPSPAPGTVVLMSETVTSNMNNKTIAGGKKAWGKTFNVPSQFSLGAKLTFDINFAPGFSFDNNSTGSRGKIGGLFVGQGSASGCNHSEAASHRLMFEHNRSALSYVYIPTSTRGKQPAFINALGDPRCGLSVWKKELDNIFSATGSWYTVTVGIKLNTVGKNDGYSYMEITGPKSIKLETGGMVWRMKDWGITKADFNTFFGGDGNMTKVTPSSLQIRNIRIGPY